MVTYGFFNSVNGDRLYNADDISNYFVHLISDGVFATPSNAMQVQALSGMTVSVTPGWGFIKCKWIHNDTPFALTIDAADIALDRIDRIVLRLDVSDAVRSIAIAVKKGTPGGTPTPPTLERVAGGVWELSLAQIAVAANATAITQADITDERPDTSVCGFVTGLIDQIDTTNLFAQFTSAFNAWFDAVKEEVKTTTIVIQYTNTYTTTENSETTIPIGISAYNDALDILNVYINGMRLIPTVDYTDTGSSIVLTKPLDVVGTPVTFEVLKSVDSEAPEGIAEVVIDLQNRVTALEQENDYLTTTEFENRVNGLSFIKLTKAAFDALTVKDSNTIYYVIDDNKITQYVGNTKLTSGTAAGDAIPYLLNSALTGFVGNAATVPGE